MTVTPYCAGSPIVFNSFSALIMFCLFNAHNQSFACMLWGVCMYIYTRSALLVHYFVLFLRSVFVSNSGHLVYAVYQGTSWVALYGKYPCKLKISSMQCISTTKVCSVKEKVKMHHENKWKALVSVLSDFHTRPSSIHPFFAHPPRYLLKITFYAHTKIICPMPILRWWISMHCHAMPYRQ